MRYLIVSLIAVVSGYIGYRAGRESVLRQIRHMAEDFLGALQKGQKTIDPTPPPAPKPTLTDTADPHNISQDLADGKIAMYYPKGGNC